MDASGTKQGMGFNAHFSAAIPDGGTICANASASAYMTNAPYVGTLNFAGNVSYCNRSINGVLYGALDYTQYTGHVFDVVGYVRAGVDAHGSLRMDVNNSGFVVTGSGQGSVFSQQNFEWVWNPPDPDNWCCRIDYAPVDLVIANNRIHAWVNVLFWDIDLVSEYVPYLSGTLEGWD
ncbi:MAG: hypothetical protein IT198_01080 [Acidimicrobiia bacterium]|nr:hypothetical protein [Acidimicrobiia bacterium]